MTSSSMIILFYVFAAVLGNAYPADGTEDRQGGGGRRRQGDDDDDDHDDDAVIRLPRASIPRRIGAQINNNNNNNNIKLLVPVYDDNDDDEVEDSPPRHMSIANMTCDFFPQPLNHFVPRGTSPTFLQRYCVYDGYVETPGTRARARDPKNRPASGDDAGEEEGTSPSSNTTSTARPTTPIFFYTGNESPLEQYINHTGLMWELAPLWKARVVFAEHRYEGQSLPPANLTQDCMAYGSTIQALADYADLLQLHLNPPPPGSNSGSSHSMAPVIVFGGSYGGMLSAWMRMKYPHLVAGAIAASAPIGGFPQVANHKIDGAARVLDHGLQQSYPPDSKQQKQQQKRQRQKQQAETRSINQNDDDDNDDDDVDEPPEEENHCSSNLLATWPLITWLVQGNMKKKTEKNQNNNRDDEDASTFLQDVFRLCEPYTDTDPEPLIQFATSLWFDLAEGSFPYPSSYIPFALLHKKVNLPAWPMQAACWHSGLHQDWGIVFDRGGGGGVDDHSATGNENEDVLYNITYGDSNTVLRIDWGNVTSLSSSTATDLFASKDIVGLLTSVREAIGIWHNVTKDVQCYNVSEAAPNNKGRSTMRSFLQTRRSPSEETASISGRTEGTVATERALRQSLHRNLAKMETDEATSTDGTTSRSRTIPAATTQTCQEKIQQVGSWEPVCCNDEMNLIITEAQGLGHDFFWPPSLPRGVQTYRQMMQNVTLGPCPDPEGIFGYSKENYDPWSTWLDTYYGSSRMSGHSNIIFSNGLLDPWAAGGVYAKDPFDPQNNNDHLDHSTITANMVQNITDTDVIALIIEYGGHHTDLMYSHKLDPECVTKARDIERKYISKWIREWRSSEQCVDNDSSRNRRMKP